MLIYEREFKTPISLTIQNEAHKTELLERLGINVDEILNDQDDSEESDSFEPPKQPGPENASEPKTAEDSQKISPEEIESQAETDISVDKAKKNEAMDQNSEKKEEAEQVITIEYSAIKKFIPKHIFQVSSAT